MSFDHSRKMMDKHAMEKFIATSSEIAKKYGKVVRAVSVSNREYQHRFDTLSKSRNMKPPPSSGRIFPGYLVVRNLDTSEEYETWIPDHAFEEIYQKAEIA